MSAWFSKITPPFSAGWCALCVWTLAARCQGGSESERGGHGFQHRLSFVLRFSLSWCQTGSPLLVFYWRTAISHHRIEDPTTNTCNLGPPVKREESEWGGRPPGLWAFGGSVSSSRVAGPCPTSSFLVWALHQPLSPLPCSLEEKCIQTVSQQHMNVYFAETSTDFLLLTWHRAADDATGLDNETKCE